MFREHRVDSEIIPPLIPTYPQDQDYYSHQLKSTLTKREICRFYVPKLVADTIQLRCLASGTFNRYYSSVKNNPSAKRFLLGSKIKL